MSNITVNVSVGELGHLMELVRPNNLAHSKCVFFASRDTSKKALDVKRSIASVLNIEVYIDVYVYDCNFSM